MTAVVELHVESVPQLNNAPTECVPEQQPLSAEVDNVEATEQWEVADPVLPDKDVAVVSVNVTMTVMTETVVPLLNPRGPTLLFALKDLAVLVPLALPVAAVVDASSCHPVPLLSLLWTAANKVQSPQLVLS